MMNDKIIFSVVCLIAISFIAPQAYGFESDLIDISIQDSFVTEYPNYDIVTMVFSIFNGNSEPAQLHGHNMLYLNDTNGDWWEYSNHLDFQEISETDCPRLDSAIPSGNSTDVKLCFLTFNDPEIGYSVIVNNDANLKDMDIHETLLESVPTWFKTNTSAWCSNAITETEFLNSVQLYIQDGTIKVLRGQNEIDSEADAPEWVKGNACLWSTDQISDYEFLDSIYWYIDNGKISVN